MSYQSLLRRTDHAEHRFENETNTTQRRGNLDLQRFPLNLLACLGQKDQFLRVDGRQRLRACASANIHLSR
jgi:hypothetical protein